MAEVTVAELHCLDADFLYHVLFFHPIYSNMIILVCHSEVYTVNSSCAPQW